MRIQFKRPEFETVSPHMSKANVEFFEISHG
jgi:hypothetical protein